MRLKIEKMGINGEGIAYNRRLPVFVEGALVDEVVDATITESYKTYQKAKVNRIIEKSDSRIKAPCQYYEKCGGCQIMHATYDYQLAYKQDTLLEALYKYAEIDLSIVEEIKANPNPLGYRNSLKLPLASKGGKLVTGLYEKESNRVIFVDKCMIHEEGLEKIKKNILNVLNKYHFEAYSNKDKKGIRTLFIRVLNGKFHVCLITGDTKISEECINDLSKIENLESLYQSIHTTKSHEIFGNKMLHLYGKKYLTFVFDGLKLNLSVRSFFQLNTKQAINLYHTVKDLVPDNQNFIFEAYSGVGAISLLLKDKAKEIVGVEVIADAVNNANLNAKNNNIKNVKFECDDAANALKRYSKKVNIDTLVVDPPRTGLDDLMLDTILKSKIKNIVYVSCNPATLAKNLAVLKTRYQIKRIIPFDMFSQGAQVESVCYLTRMSTKRQLRNKYFSEE